MAFRSHRSTRRAPVPAALVAVVLSAGIALAQAPGVKAGAATAPGPAARGSAAPVPVPADPGTTTASYGDWVLRCQRTGEGDKAERVCEVAQSMQAQGQTVPFAQIAIGRVAREPLRITAVLPVAVSFPSTVQVQAGEEPANAKAPPPLDLAWRRCLPGGCFADASLTEEVIKRWRGTVEPGRILFKDAAGRDTAIPVSLRGLPQALDALAKEAR